MDLGVIVAKRYYTFFKAPGLGGKGEEKEKSRKRNEVASTGLNFWHPFASIRNFSSLILFYFKTHHQMLLCHIQKNCYRVSYLSAGMQCILQLQLTGLQQWYIEVLNQWPLEVVLFSPKEQHFWLYSIQRNYTFSIVPTKVITFWVLFSPKEQHFWYYSLQRNNTFGIILFKGTTLLVLLIT